MANAEIPLFSIITTCKGRLDYLQKTIDSFVKQENSEVIVVDYDCPQGTFQYVEQKYINVKLVKFSNRPKFNPSIARNAAAKIAIGKYLVFVDCDIALAREFTKSLLNFDAKFYGEFKSPNDLRGTCVIPKEAFGMVEGYDEIMFGYSGEDIDIYSRLQLAGFKRHTLDNKLIQNIIPNPSIERIQFADIGRRIGFARGTIYREIKNILLRLEGKFELKYELRSMLWKNIDELIRKPEIFEHEHFIDIPLPTISGGEILKNSVFQPSIRMSVKLTK